jgi:hypothetical protein
MLLFVLHHLGDLGEVEFAKLLASRTRFYPMFLGSPNGSFKLRPLLTPAAAHYSGATLAEAAASCNISESTIRRWLKDPDFSRHYMEARRRTLEATVNLLGHKAVGGVLTLSDISESKEAPAAVRVSAARSLVELAIKAAEVQEISDRLDALEERDRQCKRSGIA